MNTDLQPQLQQTPLIYRDQAATSIVPPYQTMTPLPPVLAVSSNPTSMPDLMFPLFPKLALELREMI